MRGLMGFTVSLIACVSTGFVMSKVLPDFNVIHPLMGRWPLSLYHAESIGFVFGYWVMFLLIAMLSGKPKGHQYKYSDLQ